MIRRVPLKKRAIVRLGAALAAVALLGACNDDGSGEAGDDDPAASADATGAGNDNADGDDDGGGNGGNDGSGDASDGTDAGGTTIDGSGVATGGPSGSGIAAATYTGDTAATVSVSSTAITGHAGQMLLVFVTSAQGGQAGVACVPITGDPFAMARTILAEVPAGNNPCDGGDTVAFLADGAYTLTAGVYEPGQQQPIQEMTIEFESTGGTTTFELAGAQLSAS